MIKDKENVIIEKNYLEDLNKIKEKFGVINISKISQMI